MKLYDARVGRTAERCDQCRTRIPPHALCTASRDGKLYCQRCSAALRDTAHHEAHARLLGDHPNPEE